LGSTFARMDVNAASCDVAVAGTNGVNDSDMAVYL